MGSMHNSVLNGELTVTTVDGVSVAGGDALVDNGVDTAKTNGVMARHAPEGVGRARENGRRSGDGGDRLHG